MQRAGLYLLRAALIGGVYVVALIIATASPLPGLSSELFDLLNDLTEIALDVGLIAPLLAIVGEVLTRLSRRRFRVLDWVSVAFGLASGLWPALFVLAYSNCPHGVC